jgi:hypothetical protein
LGKFATLTPRRCFWINLPIGGVTLIAIFFVLKSPERPGGGQTVKERLRKLDPVGALLLSSAVICLLLALQWGGATYPWSGSKVWGTLLGFGLILILFIGHQIWLKEG